MKKVLKLEDPLKFIKVKSVMVISRKWMICLASFLIQLTVFGIHNNFGLIFRDLLKVFQHEPAETAWIGSLAMGITFFVSPFSSFVTTRFGFKILIFASTGACICALITSSFAENIHWLPLSYSLLWGAGAGFSNHASLVLLQQNFHEKLSIANGIASSGSGIGTLALGPLLSYLLTEYDFRWAFRACAILPLLFLFSLPFITEKDRTIDGENLCSSVENVVGILNDNIRVKILQVGTTSTGVESAKLRKDPNQNLNIPTRNSNGILRSRKSSILKEIFDKELWTNKAYVTFVFGISTFLFGYFVPFVFLIEHASLNGIPAAQAQFLVGILAIIATVIKIISGFILDSLKLLNRRTFLLISMYAMACSHLIAAFAHDYWIFCLYAVVFGICEGCFVGQLAAVVVDIIQCRTKISIALGNLFAIMSLPVMVGPVVAGKLSGLLHGYKIAFIVSACVCFIGAVISTFIKLYDEAPLSLNIQTTSCTTKFRAENQLLNGGSDESLIVNNSVTFSSFTRSVAYRDECRR